MNPRTAWRPGDDEHPVKLFEKMPRREDLDHTNPHLYAASLRLIEHGINPWNIPAPDSTPDALTPDGYLQPTGRIIGNTIETTRIPWGDIPADAVAEILEHYWNGLALQQARTPTEQEPPEEPGVEALRRAAEALKRHSDAARPAYHAAAAAARARKASNRALVWAGISIASFAFGLGWLIRGLLDGLGS